MIWTWFQYFPSLAEFALALFVFPPTSVRMTDNKIVSIARAIDVSTVPYGSWKDIKYFCDYVRKMCGSENHRLIDVCIEYTNNQLRADELAFGQVDKATISLVAKWIPREKSKFGWLHKKLAYAYFPNYISTHKGALDGKSAAEKKCLTHYRVLYSNLNRHLDTVQIKQTSNCWADIDHSKTTSITMAKQRKAFLNQKTKGSEPRTEKLDRILCAKNLMDYMDHLKRHDKEVKGKNVGFEMFGQHARAINLSQNEVDILNSQWRDNCNKKNSTGLGPMIAMIDMSGSMEGDPMNAAIALGCRVAEKSCAGKRIMTFSAEPAWINLESCETFTDMVSTIVKSTGSAGTSTNFYKALDMILSVIEERRIRPSDVKNMILAIFSDMQIDDNLVMAEYGNYSGTEAQKDTVRGKWATMHEKIKDKYADVGLRLYGQPLHPPHILFWNLRKTNGFPSLSTESNCSMMSGFDSTILNEFCELGLEALANFSPFKMLAKTLDSPRYKPLEDALLQYLA